MRGEALDLIEVRARLAAREPERWSGPGEPTRRAAVAVILRPAPPGLEVLLIRRAERSGDPWSGHMAFPGGHLEEADPDLETAARRETHEEVGLLLDQGSLVGALDEYPARARGRQTGIVVSPFVYVLHATPELQPNDEVAEVVWGPLGAMARGEVDALRPYRRGNETLDLPAYRVGEHLVWGMTHGMLGTLFAALR